jgi:MFS transporter, DHA2 family, multidrug resistance protein
MLPAAASMTASSLSAPRLARFTRPAYAITAGLVVAIAGLLVIAAAQGAAPVAADWAMVTLGSGPVVTLSVSLILGAAPPARAGAAAALNETSSQLGFALGIAILGSVAAALYRSNVASAVPSVLPGASAARVRETLAEAVAAARYLPHPAAAALIESARGAYTAGLHGVATISAVLLAVIAPGVLMLLRHVALTVRPRLATPRSKIEIERRCLRTPRQRHDLRLLPHAQGGLWQQQNCCRAGVASAQGSRMAGRGRVAAAHSRAVPRR